MSYPNDQAQMNANSSGMHSHSYSHSHHANQSINSGKGSVSSAMMHNNPSNTSTGGTIGGVYSIGSSSVQEKSAYATGQRQSLSSLVVDGGSSLNGVGVVGAGASVATGNTGTSFQTGSNTSQTLIASIVERLDKRLPHLTGETLVAMERDELIRSSVANLVSHSRFQISIVIREILQRLESLNKTSQTIADDRLGLQLMQSQLFMLEVLVSCLIRSWKASIQEDLTQKASLGGLSGESEPDTVRRGWKDPPPLDDALAKQVMAVMTFYLRQMSIREDISNTVHSTEGRGAAALEKLKGKEDDTEGSVESTLLLNLCLSHGTGLFVLHPSFPAERPPFDIDEKSDNTQLPSFIPNASQSVISPQFVNEVDQSENASLYAQNIYRQAAQVIFFISSSNWPVVFARIRNRLTYLSTTTEEAPNTTELRLIECSNLQRSRLNSVLQELCNSFTHLKKPAQQMVAQALRRGIWAWIQYNPSEFAFLHSSQKRLEGGADVLFDLVYPLAESTKKKHAFWPMLTSLLLLCPDAVNKIAHGDVRKSSNIGKKGAFLDAIRKGLRNSKLNDISAVCCIDICKAASCTTLADAGLRIIANDIEADLQERIFDSRKFSSISSQSIDLALMVDSFVAFFRLDPQRIVRDLAHQLMNGNQPIVCKIVLVKSMVQLASEQRHLPWHPEITLLYPHISVPLRSTFKDLVYKLRKGEPDTIARRGKQKFQMQDESAARLELLSSILQLWSIDLGASMYGLREDGATHFSSLAKGGSIFDDETVFRNAVQIDNMLSLMYAVTRSTLSNDLWFLHARSSDVIDRGLNSLCANMTGKSFEASLAITTDFSRHLAENLASSNSPVAQRHWLPLLQAALGRKIILYSRAEARGLNEDPALRPYLASVREIEMEQEMLERALLLTICSVETSICSAGLRTCALLAKYRRMATPLYTFSEDWTRLYEELGSLNTGQPGRIAQQKRIGACLRDAPFCSHAIVQAWREAYERWGALTLVVARPLVADATNDSAQDKAAQWHNFAGFLASLGGACALESWPSVEHSSAGGNGKDSPLQLIETFVQEMVDLLVSDSIWVREKVKETLGSDTSPRLNGVLLRMIHSVLSDFFDKATGQPRPSDVYTVFVEHSITVIQMVLGRMTEPNESTINVDVGALMVLYVEYLNAITKREQAARIRTSMCLLCESFMEKKAFFTFANEIRVRNRLFQVLSGWTTESIDESQPSEKIERLQRELDIVCLRTMSILLDKLPLLLPEDTPLLDETVEWAKSRQFSTYFSYFIKVLNRAKAVEDVSPDEYGTASSLRSRDGGLRDVVRLKRSAILALSNLLASNIEMGLHQSLPLAYQEDVQLRSAFMQIMTNVLNQGTAFDQLERLTATQKPNKLVDLICEPDLQLALSICNVCKGYDDGGMDCILLNIFDSRGGIIRFLKSAMREEIDRTQSEEMVFRSNTFRTHLLSTFGRTHGYEYLRTIIAPLINEMANKPRGYSFEIDSQKLDQGENVVVNQHRLEEMAQAFIDQICSSAHRVPAVLRELCRHIRQLMDRRFPASRYQGVGGFIFLRFINPAVVAPQIIDVNVTNASKELRRGLLLISKILQTLASNTLFPQHKEPFMTSLNDFLKRNVWKITTFLDQVSDSRTDPERLSAADQPLGFGIHPFGYGIDNEDQTTLHRFIYESMDKIGKELLTRTPTNPQNGESISAGTTSTSPAPSVNGKRSTDGSDSPSPPSGDGKKIYEQLCMVLAELGDCKSVEESMTGMGTEANNRQTLQDFMRKFQGKNVDNEVYRQLFREGPPSKAGRPVFYFTLSHLASQTFDFESFICYLMTTLQSVLNQPYDLVMDLTSSTPSNMISLQWVNYFATMVPPELASNLRTCISFNVNTACQLWCRPWRAQKERVASAPRNTIVHNVQSNLAIHVCRSLADLEAHIDRRNIALDASTVAICTAKEEASFDQITMVWYYRSLIPVTFKLSESHLQIQSLKSQTLLQGVTGLMNEVFHLADIDDVRAIAIRGDDNTFFVTCRGGSASFLFNSPNRGEIVQALRQARARVSRYDSPASRTEINRTLLPSDVPGTLLNMAMLNIMSRDMQLRTSAYDLLCALSSSFNFGESKARKRLLSAKGIALSANTMTFVAELSKDFSVAAPGVTLEFLLSFFEGFERSPTSQKIMCLQYMAPWLSNLVMFVHTGREQQREYQKRIKEIFAQLIAITVKESDMYAVMQRTVWPLFSKLDDLVPIILDVFSEAAMDSGLHTERFDAVLDTMVSFSSINLRGKLLLKLRRAIAKTSQNSTAGQLHENPAWKEIATLNRMNMVLSFSGKLETQLYLPELLHVTLLLAGIGENATRFAVHGTVVNLLHSLCTENAVLRDQKNIVAASSTPARKGEESDVESPLIGKSTSDAATTKMESLLHRLSDNDCLALFGLPPADGALLAVTSDSIPTAIRDSPSNDEIGKLAMMLYSITELAAPTIDTANAWRARMTSLVTSKAFQYNPLIQARAFILLGCLADLTGSMLEAQLKNVLSPQDSAATILAFEVDDDLLYQILVSLRGSILEWSSIGNDSPIVSIVTCLSKVVRILPDQSRYLAQMFWLGVSIIQYGHIPLFKSGVDLMNATVKSICSRKLPEKYNTDLVTFLLDGRFDFRESACRLDDETGVDFEINFGFGIAALLVKGLRHPSTCDATIDLMQTMLRNMATDADGKILSLNGRISIEQLGIFIALLPTATKPEEFGKLLLMAGVPEITATQAVEQRKNSNFYPMPSFGKQKDVAITATASPNSSPEGERSIGLFKYLAPMENNIALLVVTLLSALLQQSSVSDAERQLLFNFLADSARQVPAIVSILYDFLLPSMREVYLNSQNELIVQSVDVIAQIATSEPIFQLQVQETKRRGGAEAYLDESGYACLLDCGSFIPLKEARRVALAKLSAALLSGLIDAGTA